MTPIKIRLSYLLIPYTIIPLCLFAVWIDKAYAHGQMQYLAPFRPDYWIVWVYLFGMPHVIAGIQMFADKEYQNIYGWKLFRIFVICLIAPPLILMTLGLQYLFGVFMLFIVYHTVAQQLGLTIVALQKPPTFIFHVWKWLSIGVGLILYTMLYAEPVPIVFEQDNAWRDSLITTAEIYLAGIGIVGAVLVWINRQNKLGILYIGANVGFIFAEWYLFNEQYYFLVIIVSRVIHEFTAWPIYMAHDQNRNQVQFHNWIFRQFKGLLPTSILSLLMAFSFGILIQYASGMMSMFVSVIVSLSLYHYYTEHFLWRRDSALRKNVTFIR